MNIQSRYGLFGRTIIALVLLTILAACFQYAPEGHSEASGWTKVSEAALADERVPDEASKLISFETSEGTWINVDVSPDGEELIFDLLGDIYRMPIAGGVAVPLTSGRAWDQAPRFSPDGTDIYFVSDREGFKNIWCITRSNGSLRQVTDSESNVMGTPSWSQDGTHLLAGVSDSSNEGWDVALQLIDPYSGDMRSLEAPNDPMFDWTTLTPLRSKIEIYSAVESADGQVYFSQGSFDSEMGRSIARLYTLDLATRTRTAITPSDAPYSDYKPLLSHAGNLLAYFRQYSDRRTEIRILNRTAGHENAVFKLANDDDADYGAEQALRPNYAFTPDDQQLVFWHGGKIHRLDLSEGSIKTIPFRVTIEREVWERVQPVVQQIDEVGDARIVRWPTVSHDGQTIAFAAIGYVWVIDLKTNRIRRLTQSNDLEYMPALSPDGKSVAYVSFTQSGNDYLPGRLVVVDIDDGISRELLGAVNETYLLPNWSEDGKQIAVIREVYGQNGTEASFGWTPATNGEFHQVAPAPASDKYIVTSIYSLFVGFDEAGQNLLFGFPKPITDTSHLVNMVLATADLEGNAQRTLAIGTSDVGGIAPAPNLSNLALTRRDGTVWLIPFDVRTESAEVSTSSTNARRVSGGGGYYVGWTGSDLITFGFGPNVYRFALVEEGPEVLPINVRFQKSTANQPIAFRGARLLTMAGNRASGTVIESGTIVLDGQRIAAVGSIDDVAIPPNALVIDASGKTVLPGLIDTHYHRIGGRRGVFGMSAFKLPDAKFSDPSALAYGVTTAWEPGGIWNDGAPATVDLQRAGRILGPRWSQSAQGIVFGPKEQFATYAAARAAAEQYQQMGVAVLKEYNTPTRQQRQWLSAAAHDKGLGIVSHIDSFDDMLTRIVDGYTGGDHSYIPVPYYKDVHELLRQTGYIWTPNIVISGGSASAGSAKAYYWQNVLAQRPGEFEKLRDLGMDDYADQMVSAQPSTPYQIHRVSRVAEQAAAAAKNGVHIGVSAHNMPGVNLHVEMWYLWKGGMPIGDVLGATTIGNAEKLGLQDEIGSLEPGKIADILVLDDNPLEDISNTLSVKYTVQGGIVYDSATARRADLSKIHVQDFLSRNQPTN